MKRLVVICVVLALCSALFAAEPVDPVQQEILTIKMMIAALAAQLARVSAAAYAEDIGPKLRTELEATIETCMIVLDALGLQLRKLPVTQGRQK